MDPNRFDALTRRTATATTRRDALRMLAGGGLLAAIGFKAAPAVREAAAASTCTMTWTGNVRLGPDTGTMLVTGATQPGEVTGTLTLPVGDDGAIDQGQLALADGTTMTVVGQATGRALSLRLTDSTGRVMVAVGTGEQDITVCTGRFDGSLTGPQVGDLGEWHATTTGGTGATTAPGSAATTNPPGSVATTVPPGSGGGDGSGSGSGDGGGSGCASGVVCGGVCCEGTPGLTPDSITCNAGVCECTYSCLSAGCGQGDGVIVNTCGSDPEPKCHSECNVVDEGDDTCDGADLMHDANNCGFCGLVCGSGFCQNGVCAPSDPCVETGRTNCNSQCFDLMNDPQNCGGCGIVCPSGECIEGGCTAVVN